MVPITKSDGIIQIPANRFIPPRENMSALEGICCPANLANLVPGSDNLAKELVQTGDVDFQKLDIYSVSNAIGEHQ